MISACTFVVKLCRKTILEFFCQFFRAEFFWLLECLPACDRILIYLQAHQTANALNVKFDKSLVFCDKTFAAGFFDQSTWLELIWETANRIEQHQC